MVMVDHGPMMGVILIPCSKNIDVARVAKLFLLHVFKQFGLHDSLISNRGPHFVSACARELAWLLQHDVKLSTTYHSQTDGQIKQTNQEVETYLCIFCTNNPQKWTDFLSTAEFHHNSVPHFTKVSPFSLLHRYEPQAYPPPEKTFIPALENHLTILEKVWKETLAAHETAHWMMKKWNTQNFSPWKVEDKVWLEATNLHLKYPSRKLALKWQRPFEISQSHPHSLTISIYPPPEKYTMSSMLSFFPLTRNLKYMVPTSLNLHLTWLVLKKNMKLNRLFYIRVLWNIASTWLHRRVIHHQRILGKPCQTSDMRQKSWALIRRPTSSVI